MNKAPVKVLIADDHAIFRMGLKDVLRLEKSIDVKGEADNGQTLIALAKKVEPDIVLMDIIMPEMNGIEATQILRKEIPGAKIIGLTMYDEEHLLMDMLEAGALGYLLKNTNRKELMEAIDSVLQHRPYFCKEITEKLTRVITQTTNKPFDKVPPSVFSDREKEIMQLICNEFTTKEIAHQLKLSNRTVDGHRLRIMDKIGAKSIAGIITYAISTGIYSIRKNNRAK